MKRSFLFLLCAAAIAALLIVVFPSWYFWGHFAAIFVSLFTGIEGLEASFRAIGKIPSRTAQRVLVVLLMFTAAAIFMLLPRLRNSGADYAALVAVLTLCGIGLASLIWQFVKWLRSGREQKKYPGADPFVHN